MYFAKFYKKKINHLLLNDNSQSSYEWPNPINLDKQLENLKEFYNHTDYNKIIRIVCSLCGRYFFSENPNSFKEKNKFLIYNYFKINN